jgi:cobalt transporter subunit CbtA
MTLFRRLFIAAALSGLLSGAFAALVHLTITVPIILEAEVYEDAADQAAPAADAGAQDHDHDVAGADHQHEHGGWQPANGFERTAYTVAADLLTGIGYCLLLVAAYGSTGRPVDWRSGLGWGLAGFAVFVLAPGLGLPPEVPGTEAAPLAARQAWWLGTAVATAAGLGVRFLWRPRTPLWSLAAIVLIALPHVIGAPQPAEYHSAAPEALAHRFIAASTVAGFLFWAVAGAASGWIYGRLARGGAA